VLRKCEEYLRSDPTDWDDIYFQLRYSRLGDDFPRERFLRTPCHVIYSTLEKIRQQEQLEANISATTTAQLTNLLIQIAHGFSGSKKKPPQTKPKQFLPFPEWRPPTSKSTGPSVVVRSTLDRLVVARRIPLQIYAQLSTGDK
jgi:hypothetical protein